MATVTIKSLSLSDGHSIPQFFIGTGGITVPEDVKHTVTIALENGVRHIDTAQGYFNEEHVGSALAAYLAANKVPREAVYITTKLGANAYGPGDTVLDTVKVSLAKLQLEYVDLFLIHTPRPWEEEGVLERIWAEVEEVKDKGLAKSIGLSNCRLKDLKRVIAVAKHKPVVNQIEYHPYVYKQLQPILAYQAEHDILTESFGGMSPIFRHRTGSLPGVLQKIAQRLGTGATEGQVILRWLVAKKVVAITTTGKLSRLQEHLASFALPELTEEEVAEIDKAGAEVHYRHFQKHMDDPS